MNFRADTCTIWIAVVAAIAGLAIARADEEVEDLKSISIPQDAEARKWKGGFFAPVGAKISYFVDGRLIGERSWYTNGELGEERLLRDGELHGIRRIHRQDGSLFAEIPYRRGLIDGVARFFDEDGEVFSESVMKHGTGTFRSFPDLVFHLPDAEVPYVKGTPHGWARLWGKFEGCAGRGVSVNHCVNGKLDGWGFVFDEDGRLVTTGFSRNGKLQGPMRTEGPDGLQVKGYPRFYLDGKRVDEETVRRESKRDRDIADALSGNIHLPPVEFIPKKPQEPRGSPSEPSNKSSP